MPWHGQENIVQVSWWHPGCGEQRSIQQTRCWASTHDTHISRFSHLNWQAAHQWQGISTLCSFWFPVKYVLLTMYTVFVPLVFRSSIHTSYSSSKKVCTNTATTSVCWTRMTWSDGTDLSKTSMFLRRRLNCTRSGSTLRESWITYSSHVTPSWSRWTQKQHIGPWRYMAQCIWINASFNLNSNLFIYSKYFAGSWREE